MEHSIVQDWTECRVLLRFDTHREVRYRVYREDGSLYLEICDTDNSPIYTLEIPEGMKLDRSSYEVLLRYVLLDIVAA